MLYFVYPPSNNGHVGCFYLWGIVNSTAMHSVQISVQVPNFNSYGYLVRSRTDLSYENCLVFGGTAILFSTKTVPCYISTSSTLGFQFLYIYDNACYFVF